MSYNIEKELAIIARNQIEMAALRERKVFNPIKEVRVKRKKERRREKVFNNGLLRMALFDDSLAENL